VAREHASLPRFLGPCRQAMDRAGNGQAALGSTQRPVHFESMAAAGPRKVTSEPTPSGSQAEWRHLPSVGAPARGPLAALRQPSYGSTASSKSTPAAAASPVSLMDNLPSLSALAGNRSMSKAMMSMRKRSFVILDGGQAPHPPPSQRPLVPLPNLNKAAPARQGGPPQMMGRMRMPSRKSFKGDRDF
jgi:hypothetical protein